jgi:hypothetical protein
MELMTELETMLTQRPCKLPQEQTLLAQIQNRVEIFLTFANGTGIMDDDYQFPNKMICYRILYAEFITKQEKVICNV